MCARYNLICDSFDARQNRHRMYVALGTDQRAARTVSRAVNGNDLSTRTFIAS